MTAKPQRAATPHLQLVPSPQRRYSLLALWHLLSLDAPTVAAIWTIFVAHSVHLHLPWTAPVSMFVAVWMLYAADRLLDARISPRDELEPRHHFHHKHRVAFLTSIVIATIVLFCLLPLLLPAALRICALLAIPLVTYMFLIHVGAPGSVRLPKELAVGLFFPAAVFIPTVARVPTLRLALLPEALLFAAVCTLNCLYVYAWEHKPPYSQAHWTSKFAMKRLPWITGIAAMASLTLFALRHSPVSGAACISALLLAVLHLSRNRISQTHLRAAADCALLTPVLFPALWR